MRLRPFDRNVGLVLFSWIALLALEHLFVGVRHRAELAAGWESVAVWQFAVPIALAAAIPIAIAACAMAILVAARKAVAVAVVSFVGGAFAAVGVSSGRHLTSLAVRVPFVAAVGLIFALVAFLGVRFAPLRARQLAALGALSAAALWCADVWILPRLYPAFHAALFVGCLLSWACVVLPFRKLPAARYVAVAGLVLAAGSLAWAPRAARAFAPLDNVRRILLEHAPLLGRAVKLGARIAPPPPLEDDPNVLASIRTATGAASADGARLDWSGRDIVLVTVDALRADHVGAYGYARPTTPNIDALAKRGARFTHAYCPTPHTSYSVGSMMTGKYLRPILAMGAEDHAETWPSYLRRYGYRTAAFYPPAVFFIDEHRFKRMQERGLDFEYRKEEFAAPALRKEQIEKYLTKAPSDKPLFLWVHLFEPHEPYEMHPAHPFEGDERVDAYDSEIAAADDVVGSVVALVEKRRPGAIVIVSADHGEELGDHGGRYHGTTVYEEQVRVPLVVVGPGIEPRVITTPVQTIDLLPTTLAALEIPAPARIRGRDLGPTLRGKAPPGDQGLAFAETDDFTMVARGDDRLVCARKEAACTLYDVSVDPKQTKPVNDRPERVNELRKLTAAIERENGKLEAANVPDALRRCLQGDRDSAEEVASLLDDAHADVRRRAAKCAFRLRAKEIAPQLRRTAEHDEDPMTWGWASAALIRLGEEASGANAAMKGPDTELRVAAALAYAERGDARGEAELTTRWATAFVPGSRAPGELDEAREILAALSKIRARSAVPLLVQSLPDVRLRPYVVDALAAIGDRKAVPALADAFANERYVHMRTPEAKALVKLGAKEELRAPLARFAGIPDPMIDALAIAEEAAILDPRHGGWTSSVPAKKAAARLKIEGEGPARLLVRVDGATDAAPPAITVGDVAVEGARLASSDVWAAEIANVPAGRVLVGAAHERGIRGMWLVRRATEIPPPPPRAWDAGPEPADP